MSEHLSLERTHDLIDGLLPSSAAERARRHMDVCAPCRDRYASLAELTADLRSVPRDAAPPPEIWDAIAGRIEGTTPSAEPESADVLVLPGTRPDLGPGFGKTRRRISFTIPQLAAASFVLAAAGGSAPPGRRASSATRPPTTRRSTS